MFTLGIDLATIDGSTGLCEIDWTNRTASITVVKGNTGKKLLSDSTLVRCITAVQASGGWTAIDAPFGFPTAFVNSATTWATRGAVRTPVPTHSQLIRRHTDIYVESIQRALIPTPAQSWPLSPVSSYITPTVIRCAEILTAVNQPQPVDRIGFTPKIIETYPIAALRMWGIPSSGYKARTSTGRAQKSTTCHAILNVLWNQVAQLTSPPQLTDPIPAGCEDDAVDAFVCALVARFVAETAPSTGPPAGQAKNIAEINEEGWIHLPPGWPTLPPVLQPALPLSPAPANAVGWI